MSNGQNGIRTFLLHVAEMLVVMAVGMGVFSGLAALAFASAGSSLMSQEGWLRVMLMGVDMTVPMVLWMWFRGHTLAQNREMAASMLVPSLVAAILVATGSLSTATGFVVQHVVMVPAMVGVMLLRYDEYAHHGQHHERHHERHQGATTTPRLGRWSHAHPDSARAVRHR